MMHRRSALAYVMLLAATHLLTGCALTERKVDIVDYARAYPQELERVESLDIQVLRAPQSVQLTNTSSRAFGACTLWLNAEFSRPVDAFAVGQTLELPLADFRNVYSEKFRAGGFFATLDPTPLVLVEIEESGRRYPLVVVQDILE